MTATDLRIASLAARSFVRYFVPLYVIGAVVFAPLLYLAFHVMTPTTAAQAREVIRAAWGCAAVAFVCMLWLAGAAGPLVRSVADGTPLALHRALPRGIGGLVRGTVPTAAAVLAIVLGLVAFVVPGAILSVLFGLVAVSPLPGVRARLDDAVASARARLVPTILVIAGAAALCAIVVLVQQLRLPIPLPKKATPAQLATFRHLVRVAVPVLAFAAPVIATLLAAIHTDARQKPTF